RRAPCGGAFLLCAASRGSDPIVRLKATLAIAIPGVAALAATGLVVVGNPAGAAPKAAPGGATQNVIVVLHDQLGTSPATKAQVGTRRDRATSAQDAVLSRLAGAEPTHVK